MNTKLNNNTQNSTEAVAVQEAPQVKRTESSYFKRQEQIAGWIFVAPVCIGFILFVAFPLVYAVVMAFCDYSAGGILGQFNNWGLQHFITMFNPKTTEFTYFTRGLLNAVIYALGGPVGTFLALLLSSMLVSIKKFSLFYRMVFYLPTICGAVAITFIWQWMYAPGNGILISLLKDFGINVGTFKFLDENNFVPSLMVMGVWSGFGVSVLMFFANLHNISKALYESASLDGANAYQKFMKITLPSISPTFFYIIVTGIIGALQVFTQFQVMSGQTLANPEMMSPVWYIYYQGMSNGNYSFASAMGLVLGLIILIITAAQFIMSNLWVSYD